MSAAESLNSLKSPNVWEPTAGGPSVRGTVVLLPGRGEHGGVYERFGRRLAVDAYAVHALDVSPGDDLASVSRLVDKIAGQATAPVVLAGSDTGALQALALVVDGAVSVDGLLLVGLPGSATDQADGGEEEWDDELATRTSCPAHRARLTADAAFTRGSLADPIPAHLAGVPGDDGVEDVKVPVLLLHGAADVVVPVDAVRGVAARLRHGELAVTVDGRHDVLNDISHRTVAAQVVQWLERLRGGPDLAPLIGVELQQDLVLTR